MMPMTPNVAITFSAFYISIRRRDSLISHSGPIRIFSNYQHAVVVVVVVVVVSVVPQVEHLHLLAQLGKTTNRWWGEITRGEVVITGE